MPHTTPVNLVNGCALHKSLLSSAGKAPVLMWQPANEDLFPVVASLTQKPEVIVSHSIVDSTFFLCPKFRRSYRLSRSLSRLKFAIYLKLSRNTFFVPVDKTNITAAYGEKELYFTRFHPIHSYPEIRPKERALKLSYEVNKRLNDLIHLFVFQVHFVHCYSNMCKDGATEFSPKHQMYMYTLFDF